MTLNGQNALCRRKDTTFGAHCSNVNEDRPTLSATKMSVNDSRFWKYKVYGDIHGGASWRGRQKRMALTTTAIFGVMSGYFFGSFSDKAISIIWRHATPCQPVTDCKMNDLEWLFDVKIRFRPTLCCSIDASFGPHCTNLNENRPILPASKM